jgi:hypothetical protein
MVFPAADPVGTVEKVIAVSERGFRVLVDGDNDGLDVLITPALKSRVTAHLGERSYPGRVISGFIIVLGI